TGAGEALSSRFAGSVGTALRRSVSFGPRKAPKDWVKLCCGPTWIGNRPTTRRSVGEVVRTHLPSLAPPTGKTAETKYCWLIPTQLTGPSFSLVCTLSLTVSCS